MVLCVTAIEPTLDDQTILDTIQSQVSKSDEELLDDALFLEDLASSIPALDPALEVSGVRLWSMYVSLCLSHISLYKVPHDLGSTTLNFNHVQSCFKCK